jgi:hypothetical protein
MDPAESAANLHSIAGHLGNRSPLQCEAALRPEPNLPLRRNPPLPRQFARRFAIQTSSGEEK